MTDTGCLYVVATPIGNLDDLSPRAVATLKKVSVIAAEDTRHSGRLLAHFGISTSQMSLHEHNESQRVNKIADLLKSGNDVALISDAGTPLISDPGYVLVNQLRRMNLPVSPVPGPSALVAALSAAGLPTDRFVFEGFLPARTGPRKKRLEQLRSETRTLVFYVPVHQAEKQLNDMAEILGAERQAVLAREMTKLHETFAANTLTGLLADWQSDTTTHKGEIVLVVSGQQEMAGDEGKDEQLERLLSMLLDDLGAKSAARIAVEITGCSRNIAYQKALELQNTDK